MKKIVLLSAPFPGVCRVAEEGEKLGLWEFVRLQKVNKIPEADVYLFGAWHPAYEPCLPVLQQAKAKIGVLWTSSGGEMELGVMPQPDQAAKQIVLYAPEPDFLQGLLGMKEIDFIWFGDEGLMQAFGRKGQDFYAPYPFQLPAEKPVRKAWVDPQGNRWATLLCPATFKKNIFNQLAAMVLIQERRPNVWLHTNVPVPRLFEGRLRFVQHSGWIPQDQYDELRAISSLNLAVSWAETFNYQAFEQAVLGVPCLGSGELGWLSPAAVVDEPGSPERIALQAFALLDNQELASIRVQDDAWLWAWQANSKLREALERL